jgi:hypothetical protein
MPGDWSVRSKFGAANTQTCLLKRVTFFRTLLLKLQELLNGRNPLRWKNRQRFEFVDFSETGKSPPGKSQTILEWGKQDLQHFAIIVVKKEYNIDR